MLETSAQKTVWQNTLDDYLQVTANGPAGAAPKHVFLIVMEDYQSWPLMPDYADLNVAFSVATLALDGLGLYRFLPTSTSTLRSLQTLITGLPSGG